MPATLESILRFQFGEARLESDDSSSVRYRGQIAQTNLLQIVRDFVAGCETITRDRRFSRRGQAEEIRKLGTNSLDRVGKLKPQTLSWCESYRDTLEAELGRVTSRRSETKDVATVLRQIEVRSALRGLDNVARARAFEASIEAGDKVVYGAITQAPAFAPLLDEGIVAQGERVWTEHHHPQLAADIAEAREVLAIVQDNFESVTSGVKELAEAPDDRLRVEIQRLAPLVTS